MKKLTFYLLAITLMVFLFGCCAEGQTKFGAGFIVGDYMRVANNQSPTFGPNAFLDLGSIQVGAQLGFMLGSVNTPKTDISTESEVSATGILFAPYAKFGFKMKAVEPFFKGNVAYMSVSQTNKGKNGAKDVTNSYSGLSLWGSFGIAYSVSKDVSIYGQMRLIDLGLSSSVSADAGNGSKSFDGTKTSVFGLGAVAVGVDITL